MIEYSDDSDYDIGEVGCSLPYLEPIFKIAAFGFAAIIVALVALLWLVNKLRLW